MIGEDAQIALMRKLICPKEKAEKLSVDISVLEKIIKEKIPEALKKNAPLNFPELYFDFVYVYNKFYDFIVCDKLIGKKVVALGGGFSTGKSSFINHSIIGGRKILPVKITASTSVPAYVIGSEEDYAGGINAFSGKVSFGINEVNAIAHGFGKAGGEAELPLSHLLKCIFVGVPEQKYENIAFLDTPGYSNADSVDYTAATDAKIAFSQLNNSDYILWFISAAAGCISQSDLDFIDKLDKHIPILIIVNKADTQQETEVQTLVKNVKTSLDMRGIRYIDVLTNSRKPDCVCDREKIAAVLQQINEKRTAVDFAREFKKLFVQCKKYYEERLNEEKINLSSLNSCITLADQGAEVNAYLQGMLTASKENISALKGSQEALLELKEEFFRELKNITNIVGIEMPEPSEIELIEEEDISDVCAMAKRLAEKENRTSEGLYAILSAEIGKIKPKINEEPGGAKHADRLLAVLKANLA